MLTFVTLPVVQPQHPPPSSPAHPASPKRCQHYKYGGLFYLRQETVVGARLTSFCDTYLIRALRDSAHYPIFGGVNVTEKVILRRFSRTIVSTSFSLTAYIIFHVRVHPCMDGASHVTDGRKALRLGFKQRMIFPYMPVRFGYLHVRRTRYVGNRSLMLHVAHSYNPNVFMSYVELCIMNPRKELLIITQRASLCSR